MKQWLNRIAKIISSVIFVILVLIIIVIIAYIIRINVLARNDRLGEIRLNIYTILTQSMYPTIKAGDVVVTYRNDNDVYNKGDIITFISDTNGGITITHRINDVFRINDSYSYRTKGDNNNTPDSEIVPGGNVFGKVVLKIPKIGYIQQFLSSMIGWIVVIVIPCLGIIIYDILKVLRVVVSGDNPKKKDSKRVVEARDNLKNIISDRKMDVETNDINNNVKEIEDIKESNTDDSNLNIENIVNHSEDAIAKNIDNNQSEEIHDLPDSNEYVNPIVSDDETNDELNSDYSEKEIDLEEDNNDVVETFTNNEALDVNDIEEESSNIADEQNKEDLNEISISDEVQDINPIEEVNDDSTEEVLDVDDDVTEEKQNSVSTDVKNNNNKNKNKKYYYRNKNGKYYYRGKNNKYYYRNKKNNNGGNNN